MTQYKSIPPDEPALQTNTITCDCDEQAHRIREDLYLCEHCEEVIHVQPHGFVFYPIGRFRAFKHQPRTRRVPSRKLGAALSRELMQGLEDDRRLTHPMGAQLKVA